MEVEEQEPPPRIKQRRTSQQALLPGQTVGDVESRAFPERIESIEEEVGMEAAIMPSASKVCTFIPIREEFRLKKLWFFYHDLRAFTTSVSS